jgi:hypothetical protein
VGSSFIYFFSWLAVNPFKFLARCRPIFKKKKKKKKKKMKERKEEEGEKKKRGPNIEKKG